MHPDVARLVAEFAELGVQTYDTMSVLRARAVLEGVTRQQAPPVPVASVRDILVDGAEGLLPARVYDPAPGQPLPLVVYFHGGGWVLGSVRAADRPCRRLASAGRCVIVSVEYRRAPETRFPGPLEDCVAAVRWIAAHAEALGGGAGLVLMGDSAGGNLAAAATLCLRDEGGPPVDAQLLLYPCLAPARGSTFASYRENADGPLMTRAEMEWFWDHYLRTEADGADPRAAPLVAEDLSGLPAATIVVAELDPLRDEGLAYGERLRSAGVEVTTTVYPGGAHGFWWMDAPLRQAGELTDQLAGVLAGIGAGRSTKPS
jgi:acetyl esterase